LTFGLGSAARVSGVRITWPDGHIESLPAMVANRVITVQRGKGVTSSVAPGGGRP
jgi:hypothetical protein